jgi:hypothetical protein
LTRKKTYHDKKVEALKRLWEFYGAWVSEDQRCKNAASLYFINDFVVDLSGLRDLMVPLDCSYIWVEVVEEGPDKPKKKEWLPKMLSGKWLILECGYGRTFRAERPIAYKESNGKMTSEETEKILNQLLQLKPILRQSIDRANNSDQLGC